MTWLVRTYSKLPEFKVDSVNTTPTQCTTLARNSKTYRLSLVRVIVSPVTYCPAVPAF